MEEVQIRVQRKQNLTLNQNLQADQGGAWRTTVRTLFTCHLLDGRTVCSHVSGSFS